MVTHPSLERLKKLISALSSAQKRDFRRYIQSLGGDDTRHVRLFDAINEWLKLRKFPDNFLDELERRKAIRKAKEFSAVAGILYDKILESMRSTPRSRSVKNQIRGLLCDIQFLADMELYSQSFLLLEKARDLAVKYDYVPYLLDLLAAEREILFLSKRTDFFQRLEEIRNEEDMLIQRLTSDQSIYSLNVEVLKRLVQNENLSAHSVAKLRHWRDQAIERPEAIARLPFRTQRRLNLALLNDVDYFQQSGATRLPYAQSIINLYDTFPHFKIEEPDLYIQHLGMFLSLALEQGEWHHFERAKPDLAGFEGDAGFYRSVVPVFLHWYYQSQKYAEGCRYVEGLDLAKQIETFHDKMTPSRYMAICFTAFELFWLAGRAQEASQWLERVIRYKPASFQLDLQCYARFLQIPVLCDCGVFQSHLTPLSATEGLQRWLRKHNLYTGFYQNLLMLMEEVVQAPSAFFRANPRASKALEKFEAALTTGSIHSNPLYLIPIWVSAQKERKPMAELLRTLMGGK